MDLVDQIETTRFLGREFLLWLWFKSELYETQFQRPDGDTLELWLDSQLTLQSASDNGERAVLKGVAPSGTQEAKVALQHGKLPIRARISAVVGTSAFAFSFDADSFALTLIKLPEVTTKDTDEKLFERLSLLQMLDEVVLEQYQEFLTLRLSELWEGEFVPAILAWSCGEPSLSPRAYRGMLQRAGRATS